MTIHWTVWFVFSVNTGQEFVSCINATHWSMCLSNHTNLRSALLDMSNFQIGVWQYSNHIWIQFWFKSRVLLTFSAGEQLVFTDGQKVLQLHFSKRKTLLYMYIVKPGWRGGGNKIIPTASQFPWSPGAKPLNKPLQSSYHAVIDQLIYETGLLHDNQNHQHQVWKVTFVLSLVTVPYCTAGKSYCTVHNKKQWLCSGLLKLPVLVPH